MAANPVSNPTHKHVLNDATRRLIRNRATKLARSKPFTPDDQDDIEQDLLLDLLERLPQLDPELGAAAAFIQLLVDNHVATLLEAQCAQCRDRDRVAFSLDEELPDGDGLRRGDVLKIEDLDPECLADEIDHERRVDLARAIYSLPPRLKALAELLQVLTVTQVSERTGIPRPTLYGWMRRIRRAFQDAGLRI